MIKKKLKIFGSFAFLVAVFFVGFFIINNSPKNLDIHNIKYVKIVGKTLRVDLALTSATRERGLSGRASLDNGEGLLFIFDTAGNYPFWMKEMNFPIDIIWLDENLNVIYIKKDARPELFPETYGPASPSQGGPEKNSKYVLEVVSGFSDKNNLQVGDKMELIY